MYEEQIFSKKFIALDCNKISNVFKIKQRNWEESVNEIIEKKFISKILI